MILVLTQRNELFIGKEHKYCFTVIGISKEGFGNHFTYNDLLILKEIT